MKKVYFAHPTNTYNTELETLHMGSIRSCFLCQVENPNQPHHKEGYEEARRRCGNGMVYFFDILLDCDAIVALSFPDGKFGAGVAWEMKVMFAMKKPVYEVNNSLNRIRLANLDPSRVLSVDETIKRLKNPTVRIRIQ